MIKSHALPGTLVLLALASGPAAAATISAQVVQVLDGDTIRADLGGWVERVRVLGIDAPEIGTHARCPAEAALAERARLYLAELLRLGPVTIETGRRDRYDRVLGVVRVGGRDVAPLMIEARLARPYGGGARLPWC